MDPKNPYRAANLLTQQLGSEAAAHAGGRCQPQVGRSAGRLRIDGRGRRRGSASSRGSWRPCECRSAVATVGSRPEGADTRPASLWHAPPICER